MNTVPIKAVLSADQDAALDTYIDWFARQYGITLTKSQVFRTALGKLIQDAGITWPPDPQHGGDRRSEDTRKKE